MRQTQPSTEKNAEKIGNDKPSSPLIKPREQGSLLVLVTSALVMTCCYWWYLGGQQGDFIEIDRAAPLQASYTVDINRADWPEFIQLPGLGKTLAGRILADRQQNGPFRELEDLERVSGIGPRTLERIRPYLLPIPKDTDWAALDDPHTNSVQ